MKTANITSSEVREALNYDPTTGAFTWRRGAFRGRPAGCLHGTGYWVIGLNYTTHLGHRLAWLHVYGELPHSDIDHRNLNKADNRIENLRCCDDSLNQANTKLSAKNTSGRKGVTWNRACGKWQASIKRNGRNIHLGLFVELDAAANAYGAAAIEHYGQFARAA